MGNSSANQLADEFAEQWRSSLEPPSLTQFLEDRSVPTITSLTELLVTDLLLRWQKGTGPSVEEYLKSFPEVAGYPEHLFDLVYAEHRCRKRLGLSAELSELIARFPELEDRIMRQDVVEGWLREERSGTLEPCEALMVPRPGTRFGEFELRRIVGSGGMGIVFEAIDLRIGRTVALKTMPPERLNASSNWDRFRNEVEAVAMLDHPAILPIYEFSTTHGIPWFTTRLIATGNLEINRRRFDGNAIATANLVIQIAGAVHHAHQRGLLHRDLKPSNILIDDTLRPCVADFGLVRLMDQESTLTDPGDLLGTPSWMAPELLECEPDRFTVLSDVYGLGAILYYLLTGRAPYGGRTVIETLDQIRSRDPDGPRTLNSAVNRDLEMICLKAMDRNPERRYGSALELADDLRRFVKGEPVLACPLPKSERARRWMRRHPVWMTLIAASLVIIVGTAGAGLRLASMNVQVSHALADALAARTNAAVLQKEAVELRRDARSVQRDSLQIRQEADEIRRQQKTLLYALRIRMAFAAGQSGDVRHLERLVQDLRSEPETERIAGFEWQVLQQKVHRPLTERPLIATSIRVLLVSDDGKKLIVGGDPGLVFVFSYPQLELLSTLQTPHDVINSLQLDLSGEQLLSAGFDGSVCLWNLNESRKLWQYRPEDHDARMAVFVDDCRLVAVCLRARDVRIIDAVDGTFRFSLLGDRNVECLGSDRRSARLFTGTSSSFEMWRVDSARSQGLRIDQMDGRGTRLAQVSSNGTHVAIGTHRDQVFVYEIDDEGVHQIGERQLLDHARAISFSADLTRLAVIDARGALLVLSMNDSQPEMPITLHAEAHEDRGYAATYVPGDDLIATGGRESCFKLWKQATQRTQNLFGETFANGHDVALEFLNKGSQLVAGDEQGAVLMDADSGKVLRRLANDGQRWVIALSPDGQRMAASGRSGQQFQLQSIAEPARIQPLPAIPHVRGVTFSPNGRFIGACSWVGDLVLIADASTGQELVRFSSRQCRDLTFSPDSSLLATNDLDDVVIWDTTVWKEVSRLRGHSSSVRTIRWSPDGQRLASGSDDRSIRIWDVKNAELELELLGHLGFVSSLTFHPDGRSLVSSASDRTIKVWQVETGEFLFDLQSNSGTLFHHLRFDPSGNRLAARREDGRIMVIDLAAPTSDGDLAPTSN